MEEADFGAGVVLELNVEGAWMVDGSALVVPACLELDPRDADNEIEEASLGAANSVSAGVPAGFFALDSAIAAEAPGFMVSNFEEASEDFFETGSSVMGFAFEATGVELVIDCFDVFDKMDSILVIAFGGSCILASGAEGGIFFLG